MTPDQFRVFADLLPEPMLLLSGEGLILAANQAIEERLGLPLQKLSSRKLMDVVADNSDEICHYLRACSRSRNMVLGSLVLKGKNGEDIACRTEGTLVRPKTEDTKALLLLRLILKESAIGKFVALNQRIESLGKEIQRRKQAEEAERQQRERLRVTLLSIGDAVIVTDPEGRVTSMNSVAESLAGWRQDEAKGQPLEAVFHIVNENTGQAVANPALRALREGVIVGLANHTVLIAKDGTQHSIDDSAAPIRDGQGQIIGVVLVFRDISKRKQAESELQLTRERLELVVNSCDVGLWYCDLPFDKLLWNAKVKEHFGLPADYDVTIDTFYERLHPDDRERTKQAIERSIQERTNYDMEYRTIGLDGRERWIRAIGRAFHGNDGTPIRFDGITVDVTERVRQEETLREADRRKDEFLATLAHELRNPLAPIQNGLQVMKVAKSDEAAMEQCRSMMERQLWQMVRLVDDLLDVSRITRDKIELRKERIELKAAVSTALESCEPIIRQHGHELTVTLPDEPVYVDADKTRLAQALCNLLNNAAKYTERSGRIWLTVERQGNEAVLRVKDNGVGIPAPMLARVFDLFTQVDRSLEKSHGGLGIGLTIVKRLIEMHGGRIEATSDGQDMGSEFLIRLPIDLSPAAPNETRRDSEPTSPIVRRRILIVDDNVDAARSMAMMLQLMGNEVRTAHDGLEGVAAAAAFRPDLILLDIGMPKLNGYEAARRIRQQPWSGGTILVALTGWGQEEDKRRSQEAGFQAHMVKPVDPRVLEKLLAGVWIGTQ